MSSRFTVVGRKTAQLSPAMRAWFLDTAPEPIEAHFIKPKRIDRFWRVHGAGIVTEYADTHPGERPRLWWKYDAPRWDDPWPDSFWHGTIAKRRIRLGGTGIEAYERLRGVKPCYSYGVCDQFIDVVESDLPRFESVAAYLRRHKLFLAGEEQRLPADAYDSEQLHESRIWRWREIEELHREFQARKAAGTLGKHDPRFAK